MVLIGALASCVQPPQQPPTAELEKPVAGAAAQDASTIDHAPIAASPESASTAGGDSDAPDQQPPPTDVTVDSAVDLPADFPVESAPEAAADGAGGAPKEADIDKAVAASPQTTDAPSGAGADGSAVGSPETADDGAAEAPPDAVAVAPPDAAEAPSASQTGGATLATTGPQDPSQLPGSLILPPFAASVTPDEAPAPAPAPAPEVDSDPARLLGMAESDLRHLLGTPQFVRADGPARLWRYRAEACLIDLFLYRDDEDDPLFRVRHVEARGPDSLEAPVDACLEELLRTRPPA